MQKYDFSPNTISFTKLTSVDICESVRCRGSFSAIIKVCRSVLACEGLYLTLPHENLVRKAIVVKHVLT